MRLIVSVSFIAIFVFAVTSFAQDWSSGVPRSSNAVVSQQHPGTPADNFVRTSTKVPNVYDKNDGWTLHATEKMAGDIYREAYRNTNKGLFAFLAVYKYADGSREELFMQYGSENVARAAIKILGIWYIAKGPFFDYGVPSPENDLKMTEVKNSQGKSTGIKVVLDTISGLKELLVDVK